MPDSSEVEVPQHVVTSVETDRVTTALLWIVAGATMMVIALAAYVWMTGVFGSTAPRTAEENSLAVTANMIRAKPTDGSAYAIRAETLYGLGRKTEAFQVLDQGEKAVAGQNPALLYVLRSRTSLLNAEGRYAEAEKAGLKAMSASDDYLVRQGAKLSAAGVTGIGGNLQTRMTIDTSIQLAAAYMGQQKWAKAIEMYNYAVKLDPTAGDIITLRGYAYLAAGDKAKAKADFEQTLKYLPGDPQATAGLKQATSK
jgi:tetratricopeptide (TPR) repeat protein